MCRWIALHNNVKSSVGIEWLSPAQRIAYDTLSAVQISVDKCVNLYGTTGVGKTTIGWVLERAGRIRYVSSPYAADSHLPEFVFVDNAPGDRLEARDVLEEIRFRGVRSAVLVTREPIEDHVRHVSLELSEVDLIHVNRILYDRVGHPVRFDAAKHTGTLWRYFLDEGAVMWR